MRDGHPERRSGHEADNGKRMAAHLIGPGPPATIAASGSELYCAGRAWRFLVHQGQVGTNRERDHRSNRCGGNAFAWGLPESFVLAGQLPQ